MNFYCNVFSDGAIFDTAPQGDASQTVKVDDRAAKTLQSLMQIESFELAHCLAQVFLAGASAGERAVRCKARKQKTANPT